MTWWEAALLGLLQGLTEFLPVSSSGHLVIGQYVLGLPPGDDVVFEVFVHFGTTLSIIFFYRETLLRLLFKGLAALRRPGSITASYREDEDIRTIVFVGLTMIPTGIVYVVFKETIEAAFADPQFAAGMLLITGALLLLTRLRPNPSGDLTPLKSLLIGVAQSIAMLPGISRSGSTICAALYLNVKPEKAANFSFLMLLPVVIGATLLKTAEVFETGVADWAPIIVGTVIAFFSGILAIGLVLDFVRKGRLQYFAWYCFAVGTIGLLMIP